jgi:hypothetical protein
VSNLSVNTITNAAGGNTAQINGFTPSISNMAGRNRIINGEMRIDQRNAGASVTVNIDAQAFAVDRFSGRATTSAGAYSLQQDSSAPAGFVNSIKATTTTIDSSLGTSNIYAIRQIIEGTNIADLAWGTANAQAVTLSFWVRSSLTGTFGGSLRNAASDRSYPYTYTISSADTWEYKTVTIAGDTSGTWLTTNGAGILVFWGLGVGSSVSGTAGAWAGTIYFSATGAVSVIGTLNATFYITGVQLEAGSVATPFERRPYGTELALCQRYYYKLFEEYGAGFCTAATTARFIVHFPAVMRVAPTALETSGTAADYRVLHGTSGTTCNSIPTFATASFSTFRGTAGVASGLTAGQGVIFNNGGASTSFLAWSAEL